MRLRSVAVLGGGPGGLYAARLLALAHPDARVDVYEQGTPDTTFGFGVGLAAGTQRNLRAADPLSLEAILGRGHQHDMSLRVGDQVAVVPNDHLRAIARSTLLTVLQRQAQHAGVVVHSGARVRVDDVDADLVVAADGVHSATRDRWADDFGVRVDSGDGLYLWAGTDFALPRALFMPVRTAHGTFVTHAYPYAPDRSTFLVETDEATWRAAGFDATSASVTGDASDEEALDYLSKAFADPLDGHHLIGNRTRWLRFRTVRCSHWHRGNVVLLGDAAHTAHYSIGSGTKLAMEDAIALVQALDAHDDLPSALARYEQDRRPAVEHLQAVAERSRRWWDSFPTRLDVPVHQLLVAYMTRAGKVPLSRFAESTPDVVAAAVDEFSGRRPDDATLGDADALTRFVLDGRAVLPAGPIADVEFVDDDPWGPKADALLDGLEDIDVAAVRVTGPDDRDAVLDRLDLAERVRRRVAIPVVVRATHEHVADLVAGLVSARVDLVDLAVTA